MVLEKKIFEILPMYFRYFIVISPWVGGGPSFEQIWISFTQGCFIPSLAEIGTMVLEKKMKMWKVYHNDNGEQRTDFDQKSSGELKYLYSFTETEYIFICQITWIVIEFIPSTNGESNLHCVIVYLFSLNLDFVLWRRSLLQNLKIWMTDKHSMTANR